MGASESSHLEENAGSGAKLPSGISWVRAKARTLIASAEGASGFYEPVRNNRPAPESASLPYLHWATIRNAPPLSPGETITQRRPPAHPAFVPADAPFVKKPSSGRGLFFGIPLKGSLMSLLVHLNSASCRYTIDVCSELRRRFSNPSRRPLGKRLPGRQRGCSREGDTWGFGSLLR